MVENVQKRKKICYQWSVFNETSNYHNAWYKFSIHGGFFKFLKNSLPNFTKNSLTNFTTCYDHERVKKWHKITYCMPPWVYLYIPKETFNYDFWYIDVYRCSCELFMGVFYHFSFLIFILHSATGIKGETLREKYPNTELFLVRMRENADQKLLHIWILFMQWEWPTKLRHSKSEKSRFKSQ